MKEKRLIGYDLLRIISICMVCLIHSYVLYVSSNVATVGWVVSEELLGLCKVSVPIFFMLSGALVIQEKPYTKDAFIRRLKKQLIPFAVWTLIYTLIRIILGKISFSADSFISLLREPAGDQLWFMYSLTGIYLLLPAINALLTNISKRTEEYILVLWIVFSIIQPFLASVCSSFALSPHFDLIICEGYLGYFILGHYLNKYRFLFDLKKSIMITALGFSANALIILFEIEVLRIKPIFSYLSILTLFLSTGLFILFQNVECRFSDKTNNRIIVLSKLSIGVYYCHVLVLKFFEQTGFNGQTNMLMCLVKSVLVIFVSYFVSYVLSKIPFVNRVLLGYGSTK